jgi:beta-barrel assembly-enhancing protease
MGTMSLIIQGVRGAPEAAPRRLSARLPALLLPALLLLPAAAGAFDLRDLGRIGGELTGRGAEVDSALRTAEQGAQVLTSVRKGIEDLTPEEEYYIGRSVSAQILARYRPLNEAKVNRYLNTLGGYLRQYSARPETFGGYHFQLIDSPEVNAFAAPGGFILVTSGLYRLLGSEEELAAVLAHEIAHVTLQHGLAAIRTANLTQAFTLIGKNLAERSHKGQQLIALTDAFDAGIDDIIGQLVNSGYSRGQELEADAEAQRILRAAGYDPAGLAAMLQKLDRHAGGGAGFYKTHPPAAERLGALRGQGAAAPAAAAGQEARASRFQRHRLN